MIATGTKFGRWTVIEYAGKLGPYGKAKNKPDGYRCVCECGVVRSVTAGNLRSGRSKSCGCLLVQIMRSARRNLKHGFSGTAEYSIWMNMIARCHNTKNPSKYYGGRGIRVCDSWRKSFVNFLRDMGKRPTPQHSIDRINNDGNYGPTNCRWATSKEQAHNNRHAIHDGLEYSPHSRQRRYQLRKSALGLCIICGKPRGLARHHCDSCYEKRARIKGIRVPFKYLLNKEAV